MAVVRYGEDLTAFFCRHVFFLLDAMPQQ